MPGGATTMTVLRDAVETVLGTIVGLKVYDYEPRDFDVLPAVAVGLPKIDRVDVDASESELGRADWFTDWPLTLAVRLDDPSTGQADALSLVGQMIGAFDNDPTLGNSAGVLDCKIVGAEPSYTEPTEVNRQMVLYTCRLHVYLLVT